MKSSYEKYQALKNLSHDEKIRIIVAHMKDEIDYNCEAKNLGITRLTLVRWIHIWIHKDYKNGMKNLENKITKTVMKDLSFTERLQYELSKINQ